MAETTVTQDGQPQDAPVGQIYLVTRLALKNSTTQQEPGFVGIAGHDSIEADLAIPLNDAVGATVQPAATSEGILGPYTRPAQCVGPALNGGVSLDGRVLVIGAGTYCGMGGLIASADPPGAGLTPPELAPGATQTLVLYTGPMSSKVPATAVQVFVNSRDANDVQSFFRVPGPGTSYAPIVP